MGPESLNGVPSRGGGLVEWAWEDLVGWLIIEGWRGESFGVGDSYGTDIGELGGSSGVGEGRYNRVPRVSRAKADGVCKQVCR